MLRESHQFIRSRSLDPAIMFFFPFLAILRLGRTAHRGRQGGQVRSNFLTVVLAPHQSASCIDAKMILRQLLQTSTSDFHIPTVTSSSSPRQIGVSRLRGQYTLKLRRRDREQGALFLFIGHVLYTINHLCPSELSRI